MKSHGRGSNPFTQLELRRKKLILFKGECHDTWGHCDKARPHRCAGKPIGHGTNHRCGCGVVTRAKKKGSGRPSGSR